MKNGKRYGIFINHSELALSVEDYAEVDLVFRTLIYKGVIPILNQQMSHGDNVLIILLTRKVI